MGIGEIVGASTASPISKAMTWKAKHPNDGNLPGIYVLAAAYRVPVLLHIDPPRGYPIQMLEHAMVDTELASLGNSWPLFLGSGTI